MNRPPLHPRSPPAEHRPIYAVWSEVLCDMGTPLAAFARLRDLAPTRFLLESVVGGERWARYSFVGVGHRAHVRGTLGPAGLEFTVHPGLALPTAVPTGGVGVDALRRILSGFAADPAQGLPRFWGGLVGVWGHDFVRAIEDLPIPPGRPDPAVPAVELLATDTVVVFDNLTQRVRIVATVCPGPDGEPEVAHAAAGQRIDTIAQALLDTSEPAPPLVLNDVSVAANPAPPFTRERHLAAVAKAKAHIEAGDAFQVVVSQAFDAPGDGLELLDIYRLLRVTNPAPYMYMMELPAATLIGASPEVLVRVDRDSRRVTVRPIAGTRPRGRDDAEDEALERELLADPKERAEHLMLVDLGRNDIGRVAAPGTVRVRESFSIERYSKVMHIVSEVGAQLGAGLDALDALTACFPAGTLSGAPKVRALEIIDTLEPAHRGWYGGAVGYVGYDGGADFAICIRSVVAASDGTLRVQAGGGIVYDSDAQMEDTECRNKASAVLRAIEMARGARQPGGAP